MAIGSAVGPAAIARAAEDAIFAPGQPIVTGFSGVLAPTAPPVGSDPLDYTFIDPAGRSMVIEDLQPAGPPAGQLIDSPPVFSATAADVGQTFGVTLDNAPELTGAAAPNIYLAATAAFGLNIVVPDPDGNPVRSRRGSADATFMPGQWGGAGGAVGYPGSIWKVDGVTGEISLFTTIAANSGAGLGSLVFDPASEQFFVSDLDTGLIYRLAADGVIIDTFDHGVVGRPAHALAAVADDGSEMSVTDPAFNSEDPATWGVTQPERKVFGLAVQGGRLYYAVTSQVWSVRINADGSFGTARWELDVADLPSGNDVASIVFDPQGRMILAQRGPQVGSYDYSVFAAPGTSSVVRYQREFPDDPATPGTWVQTPDSYAIGMAPDGMNASGGVALGPDFDKETGNFGDACSAWLWATGDALRDNLDVDAPLDGPVQVHGLQGNPHRFVRPLNDPPTLSVFTDYDGNTDDEQATVQGHVGAVAIWQVCEGAPETYVAPQVLPPPDFVPPVFGDDDEDEPDEVDNLTLEKWSKPFFCADVGAEWWCNYTIRVENTGTEPYWGPVVIDDHLPANNPGASMHFWPQPLWSCGPTGPTAYQCVTGPVLLYPGDGVVLHEVVKLPKAVVDYCHLANVAELNWFWNDDDDPSDDFGVGVAGIKAPGCVMPGGSDLLLQKIAAPDCVDAGLNWNCSYLVLVQNTGPGNFTGPITVTDTLGINAPATTLGGWSCAQVGPVLTCNILAPPVNAPPGWTSGFIVTAHVPKNVGDPLCNLDNKANIASPAGGSPSNLLPGNDFDDATDDIPDPACLVPQPDTDLEMVKTPLGCVPYFYGVNGYLCGWQMQLTNVGPDPYLGPLSFVDTSAGATANELTFMYPFCTGAGVTTCAPPGMIGIAPGVPVTIPFHTFIPDGPDVCSVTNNLSILTPNPGSPQNPGGNDSSTVGQALPNPACFAPGMPKLNIQKTASGCASDPESSDWLCDFDITVFNYGGGPQPGPIIVRDLNDKPTTFSGAACAPAGVDQWACTKPGAVAPLSSWTFQATSHVNPNSVTLADCNVVDTVVITTPAFVGDPGYVAQASQKVPQLFINVGPGPVAVYCDPPSLKLKKTAIKTVKAGDGYDATFTVRATSTGPDPYIGTVEIDEMLPDGTTFVSSNWTCVPTTGNDMHCSSPYKTIPVGKYTQMTIVMHIPTDVAIAGQCNIVNTANAAISAEVLHSADGVQYTASATAQLPASLCRKGEPTPDVKQCPVKQVKPDGGCCEDGTQWNGKQCAKPRPVAPKCPDDSHLTDSGACVCDKGTKGEPGKCKPIQSEPVCARDSEVVKGECVCLEGTHGKPGKCRPDVVEEEPQSCPDDSRLRGNKCVCLRGTSGKPGNCEPDVVVEEPQSCPDDSRLRGDKCVCLRGTSGKPGNCQPDVVVEEPQSCPDDSRLRGDQCVCLRGTSGKPGNCQPNEVEEQAPSCPDDSRLRGGRCVCIPPSTGKPGNCTVGPTIELDQLKPNFKFPTVN